MYPLWGEGGIALWSVFGTRGDEAQQDLLVEGQRHDKVYVAAPTAAGALHGRQHVATVHPWKFLSIWLFLLLPLPFYII